MRAKKLTIEMVCSEPGNESQLTFSSGLFGSKYRIENIVIRIDIGLGFPTTKCLALSTVRIFPLF